MRMSRGGLPVPEMTPEERVQDSEHGISVYFEGAWHPVGNTGGVIRLAIAEAVAVERKRHAKSRKQRFIEDALRS